MNDIQYNEMVSMLTKATQTRKLSWVWHEDTGGYFAKLGDCQVSITSSIDFQMQAEIVVLALINTNGDQFDSLTGNSVIDTDRYNQLNNLYNEVRNSYFKIRESEDIIMKKLREMTTEEQPPQQVSGNYDDLPFWNSKIIEIGKPFNDEKIRFLDSDSTSHFTLLSMLKSVDRSLLTVDRWP